MMLLSYVKGWSWHFNRMNYLICTVLTFLILSKKVMYPTLSSTFFSTFESVKKASNTTPFCGTLLRAINVGKEPVLSNYTVDWKILNGLRYLHFMKTHVDHSLQNYRDPQYILDIVLDLLQRFSSLYCFCYVYSEIFFAYQLVPVVILF